MAIQINLEKYGHKKRGYLGFSWTSFFFSFLVPIFRLDFIGILIFILPYLLIYAITLFTVKPGLLLISILPFQFSFIFFLTIIETILNINNTPIATVIYTILAFILKFGLPFFYNKFYTKNLLKEGYLPLEDDEYSNALLKGNGYLEYTKEDLLDKEKLERYEIIIKEYQQERKRDMINLFIVIILLILLITFLIYI